jgi:hypothetical protein
MGGRDKRQLQLPLLHMSNDRSRAVCILTGLIVACGLLTLITGWRRSTDCLGSPSIVPNVYRFARLPAKAVPVDSLVVPGQFYGKYLRESETKVHGWINREILYAIWIIARYQYEQLQLVANIGEIGVHHGKFTCFLYLMRRFHEQKLFAVDVFEHQSLNTDGSGRGDQQLFLANILEYADVRREDVAIYDHSSLDLNIDFSSKPQMTSWWQTEVIGTRGIQLVSVGNIVTRVRQLDTADIDSDAARLGSSVRTNDLRLPFLVDRRWTHDPGDLCRLVFSIEFSGRRWRGDCRRYNSSGLARGSRRSRTIPFGNVDTSDGRASRK